MSTVPFFYDKQIRRFIYQFIRLFSNFQVEFNPGGANPSLRSVPVRYGDNSRQALQTITNNTENFLNTVPAISCYITDLKYDQPRLQDPYFVGKMRIRERAWDENAQDYLTTQGNAFTVERLMPAPYTITMKADVWTSSTEQKLQLLEQILTLFNPAFEIQSTDNYIDWTSLTYVQLDSVNWSSRALPPSGTDAQIDVATLTFSIPIWLSAPVKLKKLGVIQKIIAGIYDAHGNLDPNAVDEWTLLGDRSYITPMNFGVVLNSVDANTPTTGLYYLTLVQYSSSVTDTGENNTTTSVIGTKENWHALVNVYGSLTNGTSEIRLTQSDGVTEVVGTVSYHPLDDTLLLFSVVADTIPTNTLNPVDAIVNPQQTGPGSGLPAASNGQRYLLTEDVGLDEDTATSALEGPSAWSGTGGEDIVAHANDIIEYDGSKWFVSFDSISETSTIEYVTNLTSGVQFKWTETQWVRSFEGEYKNGQWSLVL